MAWCALDDLLAGGPLHPHLLPFGAAAAWVPLLCACIAGLAIRARWGLWLSFVGTGFPLLFFTLIVRNNRRGGWSPDLLLELAYLGLPSGG